MSVEKISFWATMIVFGGGALAGVLWDLGWAGWQILKWGAAG